VNLRLSVSEMLESFAVTCRTIDIRSAAIRQGDVWVNVYAVIRLSHEEPAVAAERLRRLERRHGTVRAESFRVLLGQRPFSEFGELYKDLALGCLRVGSHTHGTLLGEVGESLRTAQAILGHSDLGTTLNVYTHAIPESQRRAVDKVADILFADVRNVPPPVRSQKVN